MTLDTYTIAVPITLQFTVEAPTENAAMMLATEHALDSEAVTDSLQLGDPWVIATD